MKEQKAPKKPMIYYYVIAAVATLYVLIGEDVSEFLLSAVVIKLLSVAEKVLNHVVLYYTMI